MSHSKVPVLNPFREEGICAIEGNFGIITPRRALTTCMVAYGVATSPTWVQVANPSNDPLVLRNRSHICYFHCREEWDTAEAFIDPKPTFDSKGNATKCDPAVHDEGTRSHSVQGKQFPLTDGFEGAVHDESTRSHSVQGKQDTLSTNFEGAVHDEITRFHSVQGKQDPKTYKGVTTPIIESDRMDNANGTQQSDQPFTMLQVANNTQHSGRGVQGATMMCATDRTPLGDLSIRTTM